MESNKGSASLQLSDMRSQVTQCVGILPGCLLESRVWLGAAHTSGPRVGSLSALLQG